MRTLIRLLLLCSLGCAPSVVGASPPPALARGAPRPASVRSAAATNAVVATPFAADTLVSTVRWTLPADDGKGPLDSLKVNATALAGGTLSVKFAGTLPTQAIFRQALPFADATWVVNVQICTFRGNSANSSSCISVAAPPFVYAQAAPPAVSGASVSNVRVP